jgi:hypothetical protein
LLESKQQHNLKKNINLNQTSALDKLIRFNALYNQISKLTVAFLFNFKKKSRPPAHDAVEGTLVGTHMPAGHAD